jgi:heme-degrading monooxygenase HmoA
VEVTRVTNMSGFLDPVASVTKERTHGTPHHVTYADPMAVVKINAIEVPDGSGPELERRFAARLGAVDSAPGFLGFDLLRPVAGETRYFVVTKWDSDEHFQAWMQGAGMAAHSGERAKPVGTGSSLLEFEIVHSSTPKPAD